MLAGDGDLLAVSEYSIFCSLPFCAVKTRDILSNGSSVRSRIARFGALPKRTRISPCSPK
jgi:hypothetical protein